MTKDMCPKSVAHPDVAEKHRANVQSAVQMGRDAGFPMGEPLTSPTKFRDRRSGKFVKTADAHDLLSA
jgi:hypothetical protein